MEEQPMQQGTPQQAQMPPAPPAPNRTARQRIAALSPAQRLWGGIAAALVSLCVCSAACSGALAAVNTPSSTTPQAATATRTPAPPTATVNAVKSYADNVAAHAGIISKDSDALSSACGAADAAGCRAAMQTFDDDSLAFLASLDTHPAPRCLKTADAYLRAGLHLYDQGATEAIQGIDQSDAALINAGSAKITAGTADVDKANAAIAASHC